MMMKKNTALLLALLLSALCFYSCSEDMPLSPQDPGEEFDPESDLLKGRMFYFVDLSDITDGDYMLDTDEPVDFISSEDNSFIIKTVDNGDCQMLSPVIPNGYGGGTEVVTVTAVGRESGRTRNVVFIIMNDLDDEYKTDYKESEFSPLYPTYGSFLGMGTYCYGPLGNGVRNIMLFSKLPLEDENIFYKKLLGSSSMNEIREHTFEEVMKTWSFNIGLSGASEGLSGGFGFGMHGQSRNSRDYEYYMCYQKIERSEIRVIMSEIERMATESPESAADVLSYTASSFLKDLTEKTGKNFNPEKFLTEWGTDMIYQGTLGGWSSMTYSRETNVHANSIGFDFNAYVAFQEEVKKDKEMGDWYNIYKQMSKEPDLKASVKISYDQSEYFSATKADCKYEAQGGRFSVKDPAKWAEGFDDKNDWDKWALITYCTSKDPVSDNKTGLWLLYNIDKMATNVINAYETKIKATGKMSDGDKKAIAAARKNIKAIKDKRKDFIEAHALKEADETPLVIADIKMDNSSDRRKSGQPKPYLAKLAKTGIQGEISVMYFPMIANDYFDISMGSKKMRWKPLDTNDDVFIASGHTTSHYWWYALAHDQPGIGITDVKFLSQKEFHNNSKYKYYTPRGDHARHGLSGLLVKERQVYILPHDPNKTEQSPKITAFGLMDGHSSYKKYDKAEPFKRVFASTGGAAWVPGQSATEIDAFEKFWTSSDIWNRDKGNQFYEGGGAIPHPIFPVYSTKPLSLKSVSKLGKMNYTW